ncbi:MAG: BlaI/MecI/CopY family transcriptional regulator [Pseudomonadota bacterium]|jgi:predicted transcriptional regulator|mmetsp:Transcript_3125/g.3914  ORF Transcript_3125/g.3914 Transcript_3125/m.3914 type:complete len:127 (+) Transcript_3125:23-403(+)|eukprot:CAMPEP_0184456002 /NCGR_PEP_ID=MMETSP0740-20130409/25385_1 /TAXON_ID=385413 /ORGANISM="Thalassiosira miniscula, Strain CCMP1093" /LENGTH=126 /DNA_ID=CAMNT_0026827991 /DNA_START=23 /DNA_END=403 /DNA_ORIENTATION=+
MANPNPSELVILKYLWNSGAKTARQLHEAVGPSQDWQLSTTRTVLGRMEAKGWVQRNGDVDPVTFEPLLDRVETLGSLVRHLARKVLDMDGPIPATMFAESPHLSDSELDELDTIINAAEAKENGE